MANSKFYLKEINNTKKTPIRLHFHYDNKVFKYPTKLSIEPHKWCDKTHRVKKQVTHCIELNRQIQNIEDNIKFDKWNDFKFGERLPFRSHCVTTPVCPRRTQFF